MLQMQNTEPVIVFNHIAYLEQHLEVSLMPLNHTNLQFEVYQYDALQT